MSEAVLHISSAVVVAFPHRCAEVVAQLRTLPDTEVHYVENGKIVLVLEGATTGEIGARLAAIGLMDGVLAANLVFEQIDILDDPGVVP
ncbi:chaperone NapD [Starkeya sp. ORNL1]|uniref:chaperone NapD n=1 Tax=Starkeya sp. ORNL1 TaxID=2709380 RepID=UPI001463E321|nr:chaperone NapD [Starkeya sp. ORNL1]QJP15198.1 chaperone NapD [Starkeya sp. ORNL1]